MDNIFKGDYTTYEISNSVFKDFNIRNTLPVIIDSKYSTIILSNINFQNIS